MMMLASVAATGSVFACFAGGPSALRAIWSSSRPRPRVQLAGAALGSVLAVTSKSAACVRACAAAEWTLYW